MPRYFFDTRDNGEFVPDHEGLELPDLEAAIAEARHRYGDRMIGPGSEGQEPAFRVEIRVGDDGGAPVVLDPESITGQP